jgi:AhpD family alkylhydroperoxidase
MQSRLKNPALLNPEAMQALYALAKSAENKGVPEKTIGLVHLRASQINGCGVCVDMHWRMIRKLGETDERLFAVTAWRETPYFNDAERAALALTEAVTRMSDRPDPVPDDRALAALAIAIATINVWNRLNVSTRQIAGEWIKSAEGKASLEKRKEEKELVAR